MILASHIIQSKLQDKIAVHSYGPLSLRVLLLTFWLLSTSVYRQARWYVLAH
jgi:hypothetical protein